MAELYGPDETIVTNYWSPAAAGLLGGYGRTVRWRCRCGMDFPVRAETLTVAYQNAAAQPDKPRRVVVLPNDVRG